MGAQSSAAIAALSCAACSLARGAGAKTLPRIDSAGTAALILALRRARQWRNGNLRLRQMRRRKPRLQPLYSTNLRQRLYLRQQLRRRMRARRLGKRKPRRGKANFAACSFAGVAGAKILPRIGFAGTAALLEALRRPLRMRGRKRRLPLLCRHLNRGNLRLQPLRRRKPRPPLRQYLRRRMRARRRRKRKLRRRGGMYRRNFRKRKPNCGALWRGFGARLRRSPSGLCWAGRC